MCTVYTFDYTIFQDLEPSQLVLFIQSFGIPVASMTKLLCSLDLAASTNEEAVAAAVLDKSHKNYMAQVRNCGIVLVN